MISVVGLGAAASRIASKFEELPQYNVYQMSNEIARRTKYKFKLKKYDTPEEYENNVPDVSKFFKDIDDQVHFIVVGSSSSSNFSLGILEQIKNKKIDLFYVRPDVDLLAGVPRLVENATFGILQQYARCGLLHSMTLLSNLKMEEIIHNIPIKEYYSTLNSTIQSSIHYMNYFEHNEPELGVVTPASEICRIRSYGMVDMSNLEEKWFFDLDMEREVCYYLCINKEKLQTDGTLHKRYVEMLKAKPRNAFRNIS